MRLELLLPLRAAPPAVLPLPTSAPRPSAPRSRSRTIVCRKPTDAERTIKLKTGEYLRQLDGLKDLADEEQGCAQCLQLLDAMRQDGLPVHANACNAAMRICSGNLPVVEGLFQSLIDNRQETEASYSALMQSRLANGELGRAADALDGLLSDKRMKPKLRTCGPLVRQLCDADDHVNVAKLWHELARRQVDFSPREYDARMRMHGRARDATALQKVAAAALAVTPNPDAETIEALEAAVAECASSEDDDEEEEGPQLPKVTRTTIDEEGVCTYSGGRLRLLGLTVAERETVRDVLLERAGAVGSASGLEDLNDYRAWLRVRPPFDYVIDGPNVAYYNQNFEGGRFEYVHIQALIDLIQQQKQQQKKKEEEEDEDDDGATVLILLPSKYLKREIPNHTCSSERSTTLTKRDMDLIEQWRESGMLYEVSNALYDDWYWMYATVAETRAEEDEGEMRNGKRTRAITNDAMRDHWYDLLPTLAFDRWRRSQIANFSMQRPKEGGSGGGGDTPKDQEEEGKVEEEEAVQSALNPTIAPLPLLSVEAQREGARWHIPIPRTGDDEPQQWLCVEFPEPLDE